MRDVIVWVVGVCVLGLLASPACAGYIVGWGEDVAGQLDVPDGDDFIAVSAGEHHSLALRADGSLVAWGDNGVGQCDVSVGNDFIDIGIGVYHSIALRSDGSVAEWGENQLAGGGPPSPMPSGTFIDIDACNGANVAVFTDGTLALWGYGGPPPEGDGFVSVSAGWLHRLALKADSSVVAWGYNEMGQCDVPEYDDFVAISAGGFYSLGLWADGSIAAWGDNFHGQLDVPAGNDFVAISAGDVHALALRADGTLAAWGRNSYGQCDVPDLPDNMRYVAIDAARYHSLAIVEEIPEPATILLLLIGAPLLGGRVKCITKRDNRNT